MEWRKIGSALGCVFGSAAFVYFFFSAGSSEGTYYWSPEARMGVAVGAALFVAGVIGWRW